MVVHAKGEDAPRLDCLDILDVIVTERIVMVGKLAGRRACLLLVCPQEP